MHTKKPTRIKQGHPFAVVAAAAAAAFLDHGETLQSLCDPLKKCTDDGRHAENVAWHGCYWEPNTER